MTTDRWTDRLSDYLDDAMRAEERAACEAHLAACPACRTALEELRAVVTAARALPDLPPATDLWAGIEARIAAPPLRLETGGAPAAARRDRAAWRFSLPQLAAAGLAFALLGGAGTALVLRGTPPAAPTTASAPVVTAMPTAAVPGEASWAKAVEDLRGALDAGQAQLDPKTVAVLEKSLATIDRAIEEARRALAADPANPYLNNHLQDTMRRKLDVLRQAAALVSQS